MKLAALLVMFGAWLAFGETVVAPEQGPSAASIEASQWRETVVEQPRDLPQSASITQGHVKIKSSATSKKTSPISTAEGVISQIVRSMVSGDWDSWRRSLDSGLLVPNHRTAIWEGADRGRYALPPDSPVADNELNQPWPIVGEQSKPLAVADTSTIDSSGRPPAMGDSLLAWLWQWRQVLVVAPALCGLALFFVHASWRLFQWNRRRHRIVVQHNEVGLVEDDRVIPSPFIASIVERERRRSIERNRIREEREAALAGKKKDMSRAA